MSDWTRFEPTEPTRCCVCDTRIAARGYQKDGVAVCSRRCASETSAHTPCGNCGWTGPHTCNPAHVRNLHLDVAAGRIGVEVLAEKLGTLRNAALELLGVYDHPDLDAKHLRRAVDDLAQALNETQL